MERLQSSQTIVDHSQRLFKKSGIMRKKRTHHVFKAGLMYEYG